MQGGEPYVFQDPNDSSKIVGFEVEIADALARRLGVRAEFVQNDWLTLVPSLERGDFDIAMNGLEMTESRKGRVAFTRPYYVFEETLVVRRDEKDSRHGRGAPRLADLAGKRVGTLGASLAHEMLAATPGIEVVLYEGVEEPYIDLEQGRTDAVLLDNIIADRYGLARDTLVNAGSVGKGAYAIAVRPGETALLAAVDGALGAMIADGELRRILERWKLWDANQQSAASAISHPARHSTTDTAHSPTAAWSSTAPQPSPPGRATHFTPTHFFLFLRGAALTIVISSLAMALAVAGGLGLSLARRYGHPVARGAANLYVEVFRGTPLLLQLYLIYYGLASWLSLDAFAAAVLGLGLNYAAYEAELYRAGMGAVPPGQSEAGLALGMSRWLVLRRVILPQALRVALPGMANDFIALLKDSALVSVITVVELTKQMTITAVDLRSWLVPGLLCAGLYLAMSYPLSRLARHLERRLAPAAHPT